MCRFSPCWTIANIWAPSSWALFCDLLPYGFPLGGHRYMVGVQVLVILVLTARTSYRISVQSVALRPSISKWLLRITAQRHLPKRENKWSPGFSSLKTIKLHFYKGDTNKRTLNPPFKRCVSNSPMDILTGNKIWHQWETSLNFLHPGSDCSNLWIRKP